MKNKLLIIISGVCLTIPVFLSSCEMDNGYRNGDASIRENSEGQNGNIGNHPSL